MSKTYNNIYIPYHLRITNTIQIPDGNMGDRRDSEWGYKKIQTPEEQPYKNLAKENRDSE